MDYRQRNEEIRRLRQEGRTLQEIADTYALTRERVRQIVRTPRAARARRGPAPAPRSSSRVAAPARGRRGVGEVTGEHARVVTDAPTGQIRSFSLRLPRASAEKLAELLAQVRSGRGPCGAILTATSEKLDRMRLLTDPAPSYERAAAPEHLRGDLLRVAGGPRSCNVYISSLGVDLFRDRLLQATQRSAAWLEFRARIVHRRTESQRSLVEFVPDVDLRGGAEDHALGEAGALLASEVWPAEDFSDWEEATGA